MTVPRSVAQAVRHAATRLAETGIESADLDAELLVRHLLGWDRVAYLLHRNEPMPPELNGSYQELVNRRSARESIAYITGAREFLGMTFAVGPGALVPRPETEQLVEWAAAWLTPRHRQRVVDVGTGSGAIAIGVAALAPHESIHSIIAVEPSPVALVWARRNVRRLVPKVPLAFVRASLVSALAGPVDLVLANLPYLTPEQTDENPDLAAEPRSALVSGCDGLDLIRALLADLPRVLAPGGAAILEFDPSQAATVAHIASATFPGAIIAILRDLADLDRFVTIVR